MGSAAARDSIIERRSARSTLRGDPALLLHSVAVERWICSEGRALSSPKVDRALRRAMYSAAARDSIIERRSARSTLRGDAAPLFHERGGRSARRRLRPVALRLQRLIPVQAFLKDFHQVDNIRGADLGVRLLRDLFMLRLLLDDLH